MEMDKPVVASEISTEIPPLKVVTPKQSPRRAGLAATPPHAPGVLHLGKVNREACTEVEAVRIVVPRAAISRSSRAGPHEDGKGDGGRSEKGSPLHVEDHSSDLLEWKSAMEKLQNSERRLLQDKEGLSNQLRVQTEVSNWIMLIASLEILLIG